MNDFRYWTKTVYKCNYGELEKLIKREYPPLVNYCFVADQEVGNDSVSSFTAEAKQLDEDEYKRIQKNECFSTDALLNNLAYRKVIPTGEWIISVCW